MPTSDKFIASAVQLSPVLFDREATTEKVCDAVAAAAKQGAQLVVFPETVIPYYPYFSFIKPPVAMGKDHLQLYEQAVTVPGPTVDSLSRAAKRHGVVVAVGVNERDGGTLYNTQLLFDADGTLVQARRKITPTYHERMVWGQGDGSGLRAVNTQVGRIGQLACWEHYNPLARYAMMTEGEQIHLAMFPGSMVGDIFADQIEVTIRHHALESGCFVVNATGYLAESQVKQLDPAGQYAAALRGGCFTAIVSPEGVLLSEPLKDGEGVVSAEIDLSLVTKRKRMMDSVGHYSRPELLSLMINRSPAPHLHEAANVKPPAVLSAPEGDPSEPDRSLTAHSN